MSSRIASDGPQHGHWRSTLSFMKTFPTLRPCRLRPSTQWRSGSEPFAVLLRFLSPRCPANLPYAGAIARSSAGGREEASRNMQPVSVPAPLSSGSGTSNLGHIEAETDPLPGSGNPPYRQSTGSAADQPRQSHRMVAMAKSPSSAGLMGSRPNGTTTVMLRSKLNQAQAIDLYWQSLILFLHQRSGHVFRVLAE